MWWPKFLLYSQVILVSTFACKCREDRDIMCGRQSRINDIPMKCGTTDQTINVYWYGSNIKACPQNYILDRRFVIRISPASICFGIKFMQDTVDSLVTNGASFSTSTPIYTSTPRSITSTPLVYSSRLVTPPKSLSQNTLTTKPSTAEYPSYTATPPVNFSMVRLKTLVETPTKKPYFKFIRQYRTREDWEDSARRRLEITAIRKTGYSDLKLVKLPTEFVTDLRPVTVITTVHPTILSHYKEDYAPQTQENVQAWMWIIIGVSSILLGVSISVYVVHRWNKSNRKIVKRAIEMRKLELAEEEHKEFLEKLHLPDENPAMRGPWLLPTFSTFILTFLYIIALCQASPMRAMEKCDCIDTIYAICDYRDNILHLKQDPTCYDVEIISITSMYACRFRRYDSLRKQLGLRNLKKIVFPSSSTECGCFCGDPEVTIEGCAKCTTSGHQVIAGGVVAGGKEVDVDYCYNWLIIGITCVTSSIGTAATIFGCTSKSCVILKIDMLLRRFGVRQTPLPDSSGSVRGRREYEVSGNSRTTERVREVAIETPLIDLNNLGPVDGNIGPPLVDTNFSVRYTLGERETQFIDSWSNSPHTSRHDGNSGRTLKETQQNTPPGNERENTLVKSFDEVLQTLVNRQLATKSTQTNGRVISEEDFVKAVTHLCHLGCKVENMRNYLRNLKIPDFTNSSKKTKKGDLFPKRVTFSVNENFVIVNPF